MSSTLIDQLVPMMLSLKVTPWIMRELSDMTNPLNTKNRSTAMYPCRRKMPAVQVILLPSK